MSVFPFGEPQRIEALVAERLRTVSILPVLAEERDGILPDHRTALAVVLANEPVAFVTDEVVASRELAHERVSV
jgi:hypothetical protein